MDDVVQTIFRAVKIFQDGRYSRAAAMTLLSCDITSNFADEVEYIWRARWTLIKVLYIFARYYALGNLSFVMAVEVHQNSLQLQRVLRLQYIGKHGSYCSR
ncbi:hypothetical protein DFP72DRAFT_363685 [Ephemerocybe angulata]|uniref:DUF6533 domain-containing protein n=1 Tax=Ephemerocybe angulata TaxID=980116 RepID=A0A8H6M3X7_9AGAR|nr:hypothetical protein DFP72DRAFT_363685 [Tulosesus angulatus]